MNRSGEGSMAMLEGLRGVPKAALRSVLGKELGTRTWAAARTGRGNCPDQTLVRGEEIIVALLGHLSRRAADSLTKERRRALVLSLTITCTSGASLSSRQRLARATDAWAEIHREAESLFGGLAESYDGDLARHVCRLELDMTVTLPADAPQPDWRWRVHKAALA
jgi:hypothetical protein